VLTGERIAPGHVILGLASSGVHSNGFSLVRRIIAEREWDLIQLLPNGQTLGEALIEPTRIYVRSVLPVIRSGGIDGIAHITGGGFLENIPRVLPNNCRAIINADAWPFPHVFELLRSGGKIGPEEMSRTFNCGIGMAVIVGADEVGRVAGALEEAGERVHRIGEVAEGARGCTVDGPAGTWGSPQPWAATHDA
jgi:phosphoribosylformylglycinamidine cyclo-ligase